MKHTLTVLVENQAGVLSKISGLFSRRGFNIDSLAVGVTNDPKFSRITIVADGDDYVLEQLQKQLNKLIPVIKVKAFEEGNYVSRELSLIKVRCSAPRRPEILEIISMANAKLCDVSPTSATIEIADTVEKTEMLINLLKPYGIREIVKTGTIAIEKGSGSISL